MVNREVRDRGCQAGERIFGIPGDGDDLEPARQCVIDQELPGQALAKADDLLDDLRRLQRSDNASDGAEHADLGAVRNEARRWCFRKQATQRRVGSAVGVPAYGFKSET